MIDVKARTKILRLLATGQPRTTEEMSEQLRIPAPDVDRLLEGCKTLPLDRRSASWSGDHVTFWRLEL